MLAPQPPWSKRSKDFLAGGWELAFTGSGPCSHLLLLLPVLHRLHTELLGLGRGWKAHGKGNYLPAWPTTQAQLGAGSKRETEQRGKGSPCDRGGTAGKELPPVLQSSQILRGSVGTAIWELGEVLLCSQPAARAGSAGMTQAGSGSESGGSVGGAELPAPGNSEQASREEINAISAGAVPSLALPQQPHLCCL